MQAVTVFSSGGSEGEQLPKFSLLCSGLLVSLAAHDQKSEGQRTQLIHFIEVIIWDTEQEGRWIWRDRVSTAPLNATKMLGRISITAYSLEIIHSYEST